LYNLQQSASAHPNPPRRIPAAAHSFRNRLVPISECECDKAS
jgi:hypothetical protein